LFADLSSKAILFTTETKKRGWTIQHHPASNASKALPDSPGRAARKPAGNEAPVSGTELLLLPKIHGGSGSEKQASRTCFSLLDPQNKFSAIGVRKMFIPPNVLEVDCRPLGLEANQGQIKLLHFARIKKKPGMRLFRDGRFF
jgi:hypothetical protein